MTDFAPPAHPPPLLSSDQVERLISQGHLHLPLPPHTAKLYNDLFLAASALFARPLAAKRSGYPQSQGTELGFYNVAGEKEYLTLRYTKSTEASLDIIASHVWRLTAALLYRVLIDLGGALGIAEEAWVPVVEGCLSMPENVNLMTPTLLRLFRYAPGAGVTEEHVDTGLLTLCFGSGSGLQVWERAETTQSQSLTSLRTGAVNGVEEQGAEGQWCDAVGPTILVGRTLHLLSSTRITPGRHRVVANPNGRDSIVFTLRPGVKKQIPLVPFGGWGAVDGIELYEIVRNGLVNVNATVDIREQQRVERKKRQYVEHQGFG